MKHYSNCLFYALDRIAHEGGGLLFVASRHWCMLHAQHRANDGTITHFVPPTDLNASWHSLFGYYGEVSEVHELQRAPARPLCLFFGSVALVILGGWWAVKRAFTVRPIP